MDLDIYAETLIYTYEHPNNKGMLSDANAVMHEENISCGDKITVYLELNKGKIKNIKFEGVGCVISMGSADMVIDHLKGKSIRDLEKMTRENLLKVINIDPGPVRMHCATLSLRALKEALFAYEKKPVDVLTKEL